jgi:hypothetical protein
MGLIRGYYLSASEFGLISRVAFGGSGVIRGYYLSASKI